MFFHWLVSGAGMNIDVLGRTSKKDFLFEAFNVSKLLFRVRCRKPSDAFKIAQVVAASIEIDELTAPATGHNTNKQTER